MSETKRTISWKHMGLVLFLMLASSSYGLGQWSALNSAPVTLERWKSVVLATGKISFHELDRTVDAGSLAKSDERGPVGRKLIYTNEVPSKPMVVLKRPRFDSRHIAGAEAGIDRKTGRHYVDVRLSTVRQVRYDSYPSHPRRASELVMAVDGVIVSDSIIKKFNNHTLRIFGIKDPKTSHLHKPVAHQRLSQNWN